MAPFSEATKVTKADDKEGAVVYTGEVDPTWAVRVVPHGGYVLALILQAYIAHQAATSHPDPLHLSAHFLKASTSGAFEVHIRIIKTGRGYTNLSADLIQQGARRVTAHAVMGQMEPSPSDPSPRLAIPPGSPFARRHPLPTHPRALTLPPTRESSRWRFATEVATVDDPGVAPRNEAGAFDADMGVQTGQWMEFRDEREELTPAAVVFFADAFRGMLMALPKEVLGYQGAMWYPTMTFAIQFMAPIPRSGHAPRTVGIYTRAGFLHDPQGRHEEYAEVWSAPCALGDTGSKDDEDWRKKAVCLAVATQMALSLPAEVNAKLGAKL